MKNKLRKIMINNLEYLYSVTDRFYSGTGMSKLVIKVFLSGYKQTPLLIEFLTLNDYYTGQPLKSGIKLMNKLMNTETEVNLNEPKYIRQFILQGQMNGWTGINIIEKQNGLHYLEQLGLNTDRLIP
ncbi:hypothetical protein [Chryseobacterium arthrosphaerae]|uniref:Uncharacterized protein n=1 Tax=Chryseobacterium arthrosphaerae TaxID=651561 RepID=A0A1B8ZW16_9FLAO|nr:hypothetical protein [Chryseobacterium arthrosphaerae]OCA75785.1 hypothetical protein BBI00_12655 [Chryseobacterium arthrosphaerae]